MTLFKKHTKRTSSSACITINQYNWSFYLLPCIRIGGSDSNRKSLSIEVAWLCFDLYFWFTWTKWFKEDEEIKL